MKCILILFYNETNGIKLVKQEHICLHPSMYAL